MSLHRECLLYQSPVIPSCSIRRGEDGSFPTHSHEESLSLMCNNLFLSILFMRVVIRLFGRQEKERHHTFTNELRRLLLIVFM